MVSLFLERIYNKKNVEVLKPNNSRGIHFKIYDKDKWTEIWETEELIQQGDRGWKGIYEEMA